MFIEVDVAAGDNCPEPLTLMFNGLSQPAPVTRVRTLDPDGVERMCEVTGWSAQGPCQARAAMVEDSGEGTALLVYGGDQGIRLKPVESAGGWDLASRQQWAEPCLLLPRDTEMG
jgi:hypothetical protein